MHIIYEDNHLLAVHKPHNLLTQPTDANPDSLESRLKDHIKKRDAKKGGVFLHAIHRLDKPVSGVVLFAKSKKALSRLQKMMREGHIRRFYRAHIDKAPSQDEATLEHYLLKKSHHAKVVTKNTPGAKLAVLKYKKISNNELEIELLTGRYHQIRAQLAHIGSPITGDTKYGSTFDKMNGINLSCSKIITPSVLEDPNAKNHIFTSDYVLDESIFGCH